MPERRAILGIAGPPGAGKTTLAVAMVAALAADPPQGCAADWVAHVAMDGYHLADVELVRLGRLDRKGAPDTFDAAGYAELLRRLRRCGDETVYVPAFDRRIEQPIAGAIAVEPTCRLVVTEGNYLTVDRDEWHTVKAQLDVVWYCELDDRVRRERLVARHVEFGKSRDAAKKWMLSVDEPNAQLIKLSRSRADLIVEMK